MKYIVILLTFFSVIGVKAQSKFQLLMEINEYKRSVFNNTTYDKPESEVWAALYRAMSDNYPLVVRESQSRGYIEAKRESETYRETATMEILNRDQPFRVSFMVRSENRTKKTDGSFTEWTSGFSTNTSITDRLKEKVYMYLYGTFKLSPELEEKVRVYNDSQYKERKKIRQGKHY